jgi:hypothetical protein
VDKSFHASDDELELYALDRLPELEVDRVEDHLIVCDPCRDRLEHIGSFALTMRETLRRFPAHEEREWFRFEWLSRLMQPRFAMAGAFAVMLALLTGIYEARRPSLAAVASLQLTATRANLQEVPPAREFDLTLRDFPATGGPFRLELVDQAGTRLWAGHPESTPGELRAKIGLPLASGVFFLRLYGDADRLVHEYGFRVKQ